MAGIVYPVCRAGSAESGPDGSSGSGVVVCIGTPAH
jgi:hypothetical protein